LASTRSLFARLFRAGAPPAADVPDGRLLVDALSRRDPAAFEALVSRHGPTVWAVCRRQLRNPADAADAFQATFLVLLRKGRSLTGVTSVGGWLYRVAFRTALKARTSAARRSRREIVAAKPEATVASEFNEDAAVVHDELAFLPDIYRLAVLMCDLEGLPRRDAAERLGWKEGTLSGRLNRGRKLLADRLRACGVVPLVAAVGASVLPAKLAAVEEALLAMYRKVGGKGAGQQVAIPFWSEVELPGLWVKASDAIFDQLTADQRKKWDELIGSKVGFSTVKHLRTFGQVVGQFAPSIHDAAVPEPPGQPGPGVPQTVPVPPQVGLLGALPPARGPPPPAGGLPPGIPDRAPPRLPPLPPTDPLVVPPPTTLPPTGR